MQRKNRIKVITYTGHYFFPGVDTRYDLAHRFLESKGFNVDHIIDDVDINLEDFQIRDYHINAKERANKIGVKVIDYETSMLNQNAGFVKKLKYGFLVSKGMGTLAFKRVTKW